MLGRSETRPAEDAVVRSGRWSPTICVAPTGRRSTRRRTFPATAECPCGSGMRGGTDHGSIRAAVTMPNEETVEFLVGVPAFSTLSRTDVERLAAVAVRRRLAAGTVVFSEGDEGGALYVVRSGRARAVRTHPDGRAITLATLWPGDIFGELAVLDRGQRSATIETLEETTLLAIAGSDFRRLLSEHGEIAVRLLGVLSSRLRSTDEQLSRKSFQSVESRVAAALIELAWAARPEGQTGGDALIAVTQADLAQVAGSSRESASRFLASLERAGIITQGRGRVTIHDMAALRRHAG